MSARAAGPGLFDPGAQNERTALAWTRTALALVVGVAVVARITADTLGVAAVVFAVLVVPLAGATLILARRRYHGANKALTALDAVDARGPADAVQPGTALPDGKLPGLVAAVVLLLAMLETAYVIVDS